MRILVISRSSKLISQLKKALVGHQVTAANAVNQAHRNLGLSVLEPGAAEFSPISYRKECVELVLCSPYDVWLYGGVEYRIHDIFDGMADKALPVCGILKGRSKKSDEEQFRNAGFTSFIDIGVLSAVTAESAQGMLNEVISKAQAGIRKYNSRDEVVRRRQNEELESRLASEHRAKVQAACCTPPNQRTTDEYYLVCQEREDQARMRCM